MSAYRNERVLAAIPLPVILHFVGVTPFVLCASMTLSIASFACSRYLRTGSYSLDEVPSAEPVEFGLSIEVISVNLHPFEHVCHILKLAICIFVDNHFPEVIAYEHRGFFDDWL